MKKTGFYLLRSVKDGRVYFHDASTDTPHLFSEKEVRSIATGGCRTFNTPAVFILGRFKVKVGHYIVTIRYLLRK